jgi:hypothetical protein
MEEVNENLFRNIGFNIIRHDVNRSEVIGIRRFRAHFGATPHICHLLWNEIAARNLHPQTTKPLYLLCALMFLKLYATEHVHRALVGLDERTFREWSRYYIDVLAYRLQAVSDICELVHIVILCVLITAHSADSMGLEAHQSVPFVC